MAAAQKKHKTGVEWIVFHDSGYQESHFQADKVTARSAMEAVQKVHNQTHGDGAREHRHYWAVLAEHVHLIQGRPHPDYIFTVGDGKEKDLNLGKIK